MSIRGDCEGQAQYFVEYFFFSVLQRHRLEGAQRERRSRPEVVRGVRAKKEADDEGVTNEGGLKKRQSQFHSVYIYTWHTYKHTCIYTRQERRKERYCAHTVHAHDYMRAKISAAGTEP